MTKAAPAPSAQQQGKPQIFSQRLKLGEVFQWNCAGELYGIECALCEERPLCTLAEFPEHMQIWHDNWEKDEGGEEEEQWNDSSGIATDEELYLEDYSEEETEAQSRLETVQGHIWIEARESHTNKVVELSHITNEPLEPFEQVLIAEEVDESAEVSCWEQDDVDASLSESDEMYDGVRDPTEPSLSEQVKCGLNVSELMEQDDVNNVEQHVDASLSESNEMPTEVVRDPTELSLSEQVKYGLNEPLTATKLSSVHIQKLIEVYKAHPRLWNQRHTEFSDAKLCRQSWHDITEQFNEYTQKHFSPIDVRIRLSTLSQRYTKEYERLEREGGSIKFVHFQQLSFLNEQQTLKNRRIIFDQQNAKIAELYQHFPTLWERPQGNLKPEQRETALQGISNALELVGMHLTCSTVQRRLKFLRKCYSMEKARYLQCQIEQKSFMADFKHYTKMQYLNNYIAPYVCTHCGKIFENFNIFEQHRNGEHDRNMEQDQDLESESLILHTFEAQKEETQQAVEQNEALQELQNNSGAEQMDVILQESEQIADKTEHPTGSTTNNSNDPPTPQKTKNLTSLIAKVECESFSYDLKLSPEATSQSTSNKEIEDSVENAESFARLTVEQTRKLIMLYKQRPQLWDPNNLDFHSRKLRRIAWRTLTTQLNKLYKMHYAWKTLQRKLTDYVKYYKREKHRIEMEQSCTKWCFYDDFAFMNDVLVMTYELQKTLLHKDHNFKIIEVYQTYPQLWDTEHPHFTKRRERKRNITAMCKRLLEECKIEVTAEKLRQRLIDFRCNYRNAKTERLATMKRGETYSSSYEYYESLQFIDAHVAPFICNICDMSFKRLTDFEKHKRKQHKKRAAQLIPNSPDDAGAALENVCHICGIKFTTRSNLIIHLKRHLNQRTHACSKCPKMFFNSTALRVHESSHTKIYPYICEECGHSYVNASKLNQHMKRHRNQRDYACTHCEKAFFSAFERDRHVRRHLNIRDKICPICGKSFVVGSSYYTHMHLHSDVKRYSCAPCGLEFSQYAGLYKHRKKCHLSE